MPDDAVETARHPVRLAFKESAAPRARGVMIGITGAANVARPTLQQFVEREDGHILGAIEGLAIAAPRMSPLIVPISVMIIIGLFSVQKSFQNTLLP